MQFTAPQILVRCQKYLQHLKIQVFYYTKLLVSSQEQLMISMEDIDH